MGLDTPVTDRDNALELAEMFGGNWGRIVKRGAYVLDRNDRSVSAYENGYSISLEQITRLAKGLMRGLLGYAQRDPLVEYKNSAFAIFEKFMNKISTIELYKRFWYYTVLNYIFNDFTCIW